MSPLKWFLIPIVALVVAGCGGGDDDPLPTEVPNAAGESVPFIGGSWSGDFFLTSKSGSTPVSASIQQRADAIIINTDKAEPPGQMLTGGITPEGEMTLTDAFDGETWTTFFGPVTTNFVKIADFIERPDPGDIDATPLFVIELSR